MNVNRIKTILRRKTVGIAGAGGLGSNCAVALARCGVGRLVIADYDVVSESNLNRQFYFRDQLGMKKTDALAVNLRRIDPEITLEIHDLMLDRGNILSVFSACDVIVEAFDLAEQKQMLIETVLSLMPGKPLVVGLGMAGYGMNGSIHLRKEGNLYICGDETSEVSDDLPPIAPRVGMVANMQANVVLEILLSEE
jgi:sulfur carrier protein ThiS adenylyltransferase